MRPIDAEHLKEGLKYHYHPTDQEYEEDRRWAVGYNAGLDRALYSLAYAPTLTLDDLRPKGRWVDMRESHKDVPSCSCSECGRLVIGLESKNHYCPSCGADMRGGGEG